MKEKNKVIAAGLFVVILCLFMGFMDMDDKRQEDSVASMDIGDKRQEDNVASMDMGDKRQEDSAVFPTISAEAVAVDEWDYNVLDDGTAEITGYIGKNPEIKIPETIGGKKVTKIAREAFFEDEDGKKKPYGSLKSVEIPSGITGIGERAFWGCAELTEIKIPSGITSIETGVFMDCYNLKSVEIPSEVTSIGERAFYDCHNLESIHIPASVTVIGNDALGLCGSLSQITVEEGNTVYDSRNNCNAIIETATGTLIIGSSNTKIPESVTGIGDGAFEHRNLTDIEIPSSVVSIGTGAFSGCYELKSITIPSSVTSIGKSAFGFCTGLTSLNFFAGVTIIDEGVFDNCRALKSITIPSGVTSIGNCAFRDCNSLGSITIPASVTVIDTSAFLSCKKINQIVVEEGNTVYDSREDCNAIIETATDTLMMGCGGTVIPNGVVNIGQGAFFWCTNLKSIFIPSSVKKIGNSAFYRCKKLKKITIKSKNMESVGEWAFFGIAKKAVIKVPKGKVKAYKKLFTEKTGYQTTMKIK